MSRADNRISGFLRGRAMLVAMCFASMMLAACRPEQKMANQPSYKPYDASAFFEDGMSARPMIEGTVSRGSIGQDPFLTTGKAGGVALDAFPFEVTPEVMQRGRERYDAYCSMCHGRDGYGRGMVVQRGFNPPPSFHDPKISSKPVGHYVDVITNGFGAMPPHGSIVRVNDRWAIAAYLRALQLSQNPAGVATAAQAAPAPAAGASEVNR